MSDEQEKMIAEAVGGNGKVTLMFDSDKPGKSGTQHALTRKVSI